MSNLVTNAGHAHGHDHGHDDHHHDSGEMTVFGFWLYLMTDCILFASIFAVYAVLVNNVAGGPSGHDIFELPYVLGETARRVEGMASAARLPSGSSHGLT